MDKKKLIWIICGIVLLVIVVLIVSGNKGKQDKITNENNNRGNSIESSDELFTWDGTTITGLTEKGLNATNIVIPAKCTGFGNDMSFMESKAKKVEFEDDDDIDIKMVFMGSKNIEHIYLPSGLTKIGYMAFSGCEALKEISIPANVKQIDSSVFSTCYSLSSVTFEGTQLTEIPEEMFSCCESLVSLSIPNGVVSIGAFAFDLCTSLEKVEFPETLTTMGMGVFNRSKISEFHFPKNIKLTNAHGTAFGEAYLKDAYIYKDSWMDKNRNIWNLAGFANVYYE